MLVLVFTGKGAQHKMQFSGVGGGGVLILILPEYLKFTPSVLLFGFFIRVFYLIDQVLRVYLTNLLI